ncbi:MAG: helix-turn-helix domain-containing protein [Streptosporangiales bacterium]|nr:helix-turn-helix domain-containing protein [Streptosporangiales bacterium]
MYPARVAGDSALVDVSPPVFLRLVGNPVRWRLLTELAGSDLRVGELTARVGQPQNAVSYHLGRLRSGGLVSMRRSSADHRDSYYHVDLARCGELLAATGTALHPGLATGPATAGRRRRTTPTRVLFLCTGNSARSQIAEALLARAGGDRVETASAGSHPKDVHPHAIRVLREYGIDITGRRGSHLAEFTGHRFDYVVTLCDKVREVCPEFTGGPASIHWSIPDPAADGTGYSAFRQVAAELHTRIELFTRRIDTPPTRGDRS